MKNTEQKIPALRFPEFSGEWEEKRLDRIAKINPRSINLPDEFVYIDLESVEKGVLLKKNIISLNEAPSRAQRVLQKNDIIYQTVRPYQTNNYFFTLEDAIYVASTGYAQIRTQEYPYFLYSYLHTNKFVNSVLVRCTGTSYPAINSSDLASLKIKTPSLPEQQKIADFLSAVDKRLQLLKDKKTKLEEYKRGVMQRIFSQELRFTRPDGSAYPDWEYKPLGEILDYEQPTKYLVDSTEYDDKYDTPVLTAGKTFVLGYTNETYGIYEENLPVIIFDDFTTASKFVTFPFKAKSSAMKILKAREGVNIRFVYEAMQRIEYIVGAHGRHWISTFSNMEIPYPSLDEQRQIADFLSAIDDKISLLNQQIASTEQYKKGLLQQMFV